MGSLKGQGLPVKILEDLVLKGSYAEDGLVGERCAGKNKKNGKLTQLAKEMN